MSSPWYEPELITWVLCVLTFNLVCARYLRKALSGAKPAFPRRAVRRVLYGALALSWPHAFFQYLFHQWLVATFFALLGCWIVWLIRKVGKDDDDRKDTFRARAKVKWRTFAPSPIRLVAPSPA